MRPFQRYIAFQKRHNFHFKTQASVFGRIFVIHKDRVHSQFQPEEELRRLSSSVRPLKPVRRIASNLVRSPRDLGSVKDRWTLLFPDSKLFTIHLAALDQMPLMNCQSLYLVNCKLSSTKNIVSHQNTGTWCDLNTFLIWDFHCTKSNFTSERTGELLANENFWRPSSLTENSDEGEFLNKILYAKNAFRYLEICLNNANWTAHQSMEFTEFYDR